MHSCDDFRTAFLGITQLECSSLLFGLGRASVASALKNPLPTTVLGSDTLILLLVRSSRQYSTVQASADINRLKRWARFVTFTSHLNDWPGTFLADR